MGTIRWFFLRMALGASLFAGVAVTPVRSDTAQYLQSRHPVAMPAGAKGLCKTYAWACAPAASEDRAFSREDLRLVRRVNNRINRGVRQIEDSRQYAEAEVWALPTARGGDCEDFALLKKRELMNAGISSDRLLIAMVLDRQMRGHAVLVVRSHRGDLVLDNMTNRILPWDRTGYIFLKMQNPNKPSEWDAILAGGPLLKRSTRG